jgi:hypothetical protein
VVESGYSVQLDDGSVEDLMHPGERDHLRMKGWSWGLAEAEARLVEVTYMICQACGGIHERRRFAPPFGCLAAGVGCVAGVLWAVAIAGMMMGAWVERRGFQWPVVLLMFSTAAAGIIWGRHRLNVGQFRRCVRRRPKLLDVPCCGHADPSRLMFLFEAEATMFPCCECGAREAVIVKRTGMT